jgi:trimeric autotransporter adhesin
LVPIVGLLGVLAAVPLGGTAVATAPPPGSTPNEMIAVAGGGIDTSLAGLQPASQLQLSDPRGTAVTTSGDVYIADTNNNVIREVSPAGASRVVAGDGIAGFSGNGGNARTAELDHPQGVAVGSNGTLYIADTGNNEIRSVSGGVIKDFAGTGTAGYSGDNGAPTSAQLDAPYAIAVEGTTVFIADTGNNVVREAFTPIHVDGSHINPFAPRIITYAGGGTDGFGDGGPATSAELSEPTGVALDGNGRLYIADSGNSAIRVVNFDESISTVVDVPYPRSVAVDPPGDIFMTDPEESEVLEQPAAGPLKVLAGIGQPGDSGNGGLGTAAALDHPSGVAVDQYGDAFIADSGNDLVREVVAPRAPTFTRAIAPTTGRAGTLYSGRFAAQGVAAPKLSLGSGHPAWLHITARGLVEGHVPSGIKTFTYSVIAKNAAGEATEGPYIVTVPRPYKVVAVSPTSAFASPWGITNLSNGEMLVADAAHDRIDTVSPALSPVAHFGIPGTLLGRLNHPTWATAHGTAGNIYVSDTSNNRIDEFSSGGSFIGHIGSLGSAPGKFKGPEGLAFGPNGDLYVADTGNSRVEQFSGTGAFIRAFGTAGTGPHEFEAPTSVAFSSAGLLYVSDDGNRRIQIRTLTGVYHGHLGKAGTAIGEFKDPFAMAVDSGGNLFVTDRDLSRVEEFSSVGQAVNQFGVAGHASNDLLHPTGITVSATGIVTISDFGNHRVKSFRNP